MAMALSHVPPWLWRKQPEISVHSDTSSVSHQSTPPLSDEIRLLRYSENVPCLWNDEAISLSQSRRRSSKGGTIQQHHHQQQQQDQQRQPGRKTEVAMMRRQRSGGSRKWLERQVDPEFDLVVVPPDGCCMSGSDSEDSDWSVGWFEPHSSDFSDSEENFAVIVPCYGSSSPKLVAASRNGFFLSEDPQVPLGTSVLSRMSRRTSAEHKVQVEQWLASLQE
ncbi:hypothetical protein O6H91_10G076300 [Diphasiastrum complanatum]|uniref:Uncharacterized protein n=1 Tax=Diphasiastrum complanatum TaxID=34168 RepID=A0ACC2CIH3_DIPCM|nr:hypothetical protein O6H91_10G076300 [Diphasiastrum complanatum]